MTEEDEKLLIQVLSISTTSGYEKRAKKFIRGWLRDNNIPYYCDSVGNTYATKSDGTGLPYPCMVSHIDTVHPICDDKYVWYIADTNHDQLAAWNRKTGDPCGVGGDDLNGVWLCLKALQTMPRMKAAFFVEEETGCCGSGEADMSFFADCSMVLQGDRKGSSDITGSIMGDTMNSTEFAEAIGPIMASYGRQWVDGGMTDVWALKTNSKSPLPVSCANLSCGYHDPHRPGEYVVISELQHTLEFVIDIFTRMGNVTWPHAYTRKAYSGLDHGRYGSYTRYDSKWDPWDDQDFVDFKKGKEKAKDRETDFTYDNGDGTVTRLFYNGQGDWDEETLRSPTSGPGLLHDTAHCLYCQSPGLEYDEFEDGWYCFGCDNYSNPEDIELHYPMTDVPF